MRTEQSYPSPTYGVSTLAPNTRPQGFASKQVNFRSDPINKLTRRPSSLYKQLITGITDPDSVKYHSYTRDGIEYSFIIDTITGDIYCIVDNVLVDTLSLGAYNGTDLGLYTIDHDTYILNRDRVVETLPDTDAASIQKVSYVNVMSALNYGETIQVNITRWTGVRDTVAYSVPDLGVTDPDYDTADKARATKRVAQELAAAINSGGVYPKGLLSNVDYPDDPVNDTDWNLYCKEYDQNGQVATYDPTKSVCKPYQDQFLGVPDVTAVALGSTVAIYENTRANWLQVEVEAGQGTRSAIAINAVIESTDGLPLYAVVGTRITVRPDPTSEKGIYYLQAERVADTASGEILEEVVWSETRHPTQEHSLDTTTLPHKVEYDGSNFTISTVNFRSRQSGDEDSTPFPEFVGKTLQSMGYFQKRLVVVAENAVYMTETDDLRNWFRQSAVQLLVTDPIGVTTSELGTDKILHLVPHNRDLLVITSNSQFKISGNEALTPETVSMPLTTKYECQDSVAPVTIGNSVYFPIDYGDSTGIQEYSGQRNTSQDLAISVTNHVIGYLSGTAKLLAASPNLEMIAMTTTESPDNTLFIYEQYTTSQGKRVQQSWSTWQFAADEKVIDIKFRKNELIVLVARGTDLIVKAIPMYTRVTTSPLDVHLDDLLILDTTGTTVTVPTGYSTTDCIAVRGDGTDNELWQVQYTRAGDVLTFNEDIGAGKVYVGRTFKSEYEPNRPFKYDEDGSTITSDKLRVSRWVLSLVDTHEISMLKESKHSDDVTSKFESRFVGQYPLGTMNAYTGDWKFSFAEDAALATATFFTDNHLGCTISDISWEGQYYQSKQRMR